MFSQIFYSRLHHIYYPHIKTPTLSLHVLCDQKHQTKKKQKSFMTNGSKFEKIFRALDELFPKIDTIKQDKSQEHGFKLSRKYPKTRKHTKIEILKQKKDISNNQCEKTFYENLVCGNKSCIQLNQTNPPREINSNTLENIIMDLEQTRVFSKYPPDQVANGLTSYILYVLVETNPLDLVNEKINLKTLNIFLLDLSKYVTNEITLNPEEKIIYYSEILKLLKERNNLAAIESILTGIKSCRLEEKQFESIAVFERNLRNEETEIFLNNENSLPSIGVLLNKLSNRNNSEEFISIIEYFSNLKEGVSDEDIEYDIYRTVEDFNTNLKQKNQEYPPIYFDLIKKEV